MYHNYEQRRVFALHLDMESLDSSNSLGRLLAIVVTRALSKPALECHELPIVDLLVAPCLASTSTHTHHDAEQTVTINQNIDGQFITLRSRKK